jgi:hypothetical protein
MDTPYRLKIKVGPHEFEAEGSPADVREQFEAFKEMISVVPVIPAPNPQTPAPPILPSEGSTPEKTDVPSGDLALSKIMKLEGRTISLTVRPKTLVEAILLILLGQKSLRQNDSVTGGEILDGLKTTGGLAFGRIDRVMESIGKDGDVIVTGENRGKRYRMTNAGVAKARRLAAELIAIVA